MVNAMNKPVRVILNALYLFFESMMLLLYKSMAEVYTKTEHIKITRKDIFYITR